MSYRNMKKWEMFKRVICILTLNLFLISNISFAATDFSKDHSSEVEKSALAVDTLAIPRDYGTIKERSNGGNGKFVVYIQDAHCNYEAQTNIVKILEYLIKHYNVNFVAVEGADGIVDTSWFKAFPDQDIKREVADYFMKKGEITGTEFLSITSDYPFTIYGAEDRKHYINNLNSFLESYPHKEEFVRYYANIKSILGKLKKYIYTKELRILDNKIEEHKDKRLKFADYVRYLHDRSKNPGHIDIKTFPNFNILIEALKFEKDINFDVVNDERAILIDELSKRLSKDKLSELVNKSLEFKLGKIEGNSFYSYLAKLAEENDITISKKYENLNRYIIYSRIYAKIDNEKLFDEIDDLLTAIKENMFTNDDQRTLDKLWKDVNVILGFMNIELTNKEYEYYIENKENFAPANFISFIKSQATRFGLTYNIETPSEELNNAFKRLIDFYEIALERDRILVKNMFKGMGGKKTDVGVLITGGFHTKGVTKYLKEKDTSYIVISPSITQDAESPYIAVLTNQRTPFEEILVGSDAAQSKQGMLGPYSIASAVKMYFRSPEKLKALSREMGEVRGEGLYDRAIRDAKAWTERYTRRWYERVRNEFGSGKLIRNNEVMLKAFELALETRLEELIENAREREDEELAAALKRDKDLIKGNVLVFAAPVLEKLVEGAQIMPVEVGVVAQRVTTAKRPEPKVRESLSGAPVAKKAPGTATPTAEELNHIYQEQVTKFPQGDVAISQDVIDLINERGPPEEAQRLIAALRTSAFKVKWVDLGSNEFFFRRIHDTSFPGINAFYHFPTATLYFPRAFIQVTDRYLLAQGIVHEYVEEFGKEPEFGTRHSMAVIAEMGLVSSSARAKGISDYTQFFMDKAADSGNYRYLLHLISTYDTRRDPGGKFLRAVYTTLDRLMDANGLPRQGMTLKTIQEVLAWYRYSFETSRTQYKGIKPYDKARLVSQKIDDMVSAGNLSIERRNQCFFSKSYDENREEKIWIPQSFIRGPPEWFTYIPYMPIHDDHVRGLESAMEALKGKIKAEKEKLRQIGFVKYEEVAQKEFKATDEWKRAWQAVEDAYLAETQEEYSRAVEEAKRLWKIARETRAGIAATTATEVVVGKEDKEDSSKSIPPLPGILTIREELNKELEDLRVQYYSAIHRPFLEFVYQQIEAKKREKEAQGDYRPVVVAICGSGGTGKSTLEEPLRDWAVQRYENNEVTRIVREIVNGVETDVPHLTIGVIPTDTIGLHPGENKRYVSVAGGERLTIVKGHEMYSPDTINDALIALLTGRTIMAPEKDRGGKLKKGDIVGPVKNIILMEGITPAHFTQVRDKIDIVIAIAEENDEDRFDRKVERDTTPKYFGGPRDLPRQHVINDFCDKQFHERHDMVAVDIREVADIVWAYNEDLTRPSYVAVRSSVFYPKRAFGLPVSPRIKGFLVGLESGIRQVIAGERSAEESTIPQALKDIIAVYAESGKQILVRNLIEEAVKDVARRYPQFNPVWLRKRLTPKEQSVLKPILDSIDFKQLGSRLSLSGREDIVATLRTWLNEGVEEIIGGNNAIGINLFASALREVTIQLQEGRISRADAKQLITNTAAKYPIFSRGWLARALALLSQEEKGELGSLIQEVVADTQKSKKVVTVIPVGGRGARFAPFGWAILKPFYPLFGKSHFMHAVERALATGQNPQNIFFFIEEEMIEPAKEELRRVRIQIPNENFIPEITGIDQEGREQALEKAAMFGMAAQHIAKLRGPETVIVFERSDLVLQGSTDRETQGIMQELAAAIGNATTAAALEPTISILGNPPTAQEKHAIESRAQNPPSGKGYIFPANDVETLVSGTQLVDRFHEKPDVAKTGGEGVRFALQQGLITQADLNPAGITLPAGSVVSIEDKMLVRIGVELARKYIAQGARYNASYFIFRADTTSKAFEAIRRDEYKKLLDYEKALGTPDEERARKEITNYFIQKERRKAFEEAIVQPLTSVIGTPVVNIGIAVASFGENVAQNWVGSQGSLAAVWAFEKIGDNYFRPLETAEHAKLGSAVKGCNILLAPTDTTTRVHVYGISGLAVAYEESKGALVVAKETRNVDAITKTVKSDSELSAFTEPGHPRPMVAKSIVTKGTVGNKATLGTNGSSVILASNNTVVYSEEGIVCATNLSNVIIISRLENGVRHIYVYGPEAQYEGLEKLAELSTVRRASASGLLAEVQAELEARTLTPEKAEEYIKTASDEFKNAFETTGAYIREYIDVIILITNRVQLPGKMRLFQLAQEFKDRHTPQHTMVYYRINAQAMQFYRNPDNLTTEEDKAKARIFDRKLTGYGLDTEAQIVNRVTRLVTSPVTPFDMTRQNKIKRVFVLSRLKAGGDVYCNGLIFQALKRAFPPTTNITLLGAPSIVDQLFGGDERYSREGREFIRGSETFFARFENWYLMTEAVETVVRRENLQKGEYLIFDSASPFLQLGTLPLIKGELEAKEVSYYFYDMIPEGDNVSIARDMVGWLEKIFGTRNVGGIHPILAIPQAHKDKAEIIWNRLKLTGRNVIVVSFGTDLDYEKWISPETMEFETKLLVELVKEGYVILFSKGAKKERPKAEEILDAYKKLTNDNSVVDIDTTKIADIPEVSASPNIVAFQGEYGDFAALMQKSTQVASYSSSPKHIAAAVQRPVTVIYVREAGFDIWEPYAPYNQNSVNTIPITPAQTENIQQSLNKVMESIRNLSSKSRASASGQPLTPRQEELMRLLSTSPIENELEPNLVYYAWGGMANNVVVRRLSGKAIAEIWFNSTQPTGDRKLLSTIPGTAIEGERPITLKELLESFQEMLGAHKAKPIFVKFLSTRFPPRVHMGFNDKILKVGEKQFIKWLQKERRMAVQLKDALVAAGVTADQFSKEFMPEYERWAISQAIAEDRWGLVGNIPHLERFELTLSSEWWDELRKNRAEIVSVLNEIELKPGMVVLSPVMFPHGIFGLGLQTHPPSEHPQAKNEAWIVISAGIDEKTGEHMIILVEPQQMSNVTYNLADFYTPIQPEGGTFIMRKYPDTFNKGLDALAPQGQEPPKIVTEKDVVERAIPLIASKGLRYVATTIGDFDRTDEVENISTRENRENNVKVEALIINTYENRLSNQEAFGKIDIWPEELFRVERITFGAYDKTKLSSVEVAPEKNNYHELIVTKGSVTVNRPNRAPIELSLRSPLFMPATITEPYTITAKGEAEVLALYPVKEAEPTEEGAAPTRLSTSGLAKELAESGRPITFAVPNIRIGQHGFTWGEFARYSKILKFLGITPQELRFAEDEPVSEAWIASDDGKFPSQIILPNGEPVSLREFLAAHAAEILGKEHVEAYGPYLGVVMKLLDARDTLSIAVHPTEGHPTLPPKPEYWKMMGEGATVYFGFKDDVTATEVARSVPQPSAEVRAILKKLQANDKAIEKLVIKYLQQLQEPAVRAELEAADLTFHELQLLVAFLDQNGTLEDLLNIEEYAQGDLVDVPGAVIHAIRGRTKEAVGRSSFVAEWSQAPAKPEVEKGLDLGMAAVSIYDRDRLIGKRARPNKEKPEATIAVMQDAVDRGIFPGAFGQINPKEYKLKPVPVFHDIYGNSAQRLFESPVVIVEQAYVQKGYPLTVKDLKGRGYPIFVEEGSVEISGINEKTGEKVAIELEKGQGAIIPATISKSISITSTSVSSVLQRWFAPLPEERELIKADQEKAKAESRQPSRTATAQATTEYSSKDRFGSEEIYKISTKPDELELAKWLSSITLSGTLDKRAVIIAYDTGLDLSVHTGPVAQAGERSINRYLNGQLVNIRATGKDLADDIKSAIMDFEAKGIPYRVVSIAGKDTVDKNGEELAKLGKVLDIQNPDGRYIPIIGLYEVALRIAYDSKVEDILASLNRISFNPKNPDNKFTKDDLEKGIIVLLPKIVPISFEDAVKAYKAAQRVLLSL